jgi:3-isopropylmalate dehydratase small subunit
VTESGSGRLPVLIRGRVWRFGHDVDTDVMAPWGTISAPFEERRSKILAIRSSFAAQVSPGDVIVAGRNWGCGSSREQAPENLQRLGVAAVVAESFGRIYFRNAIAIGFPNVACPGVHDAFADGDELELVVREALVRNPGRGIELQGRPWTPDMADIVAAGGLLEVLKAKPADRGDRGGGAAVAVRGPATGEAGP